VSFTVAVYCSFGAMKGEFTAIGWAAISLEDFPARRGVVSMKNCSPHLFQVKDLWNIQSLWMQVASMWM
jgi:hypothetical protein